MPAQPRHGAGASPQGGVRLDVRIDAQPATDEFRRARRELNQTLREGLRRAGERVVLPAAKRRAGGLKIAGTPIASTLVVKARSSEAVLTTNMRGKLARAVGLMEFGGTVKTIIEPRKAQALTVGDGVVANVTTPRVYHGRRFMLGAVDAAADQIDDILLEETLKAFDGFEVT